MEITLHEKEKMFTFLRQKGKGRTLDFFSEKITVGDDLSSDEASEAMRLLVSGEASEYQQGQFLTALYMKGATADEITAFAITLRELATQIEIKTDVASGAILGDTCGTGGGTLETFNVSTTIMFILASAGIIIAKHGNRAITSKCGSADVLEALDININLEPQKVAECISTLGIGFIFAPNFHKAFKNVQKVRKELGFPTVFNILGPLANPAFSTPNAHYSQVLGVNDPELTWKIAETLKRLKVKRAIVVYGYSNGGDSKGMDELSTVGKTKVSEVKADGSIENYFLEPEEVGLKP